MDGKTIIKRDGTVETIVLNRDAGESCQEVTRITSRLGNQVSEEITGPDCDTTAHEVVVNE